MITRFNLLKLKDKHLYLSGAVCLLAASIFSVGFNHVDEHFQILEFAGLKLGLTTSENLPWEFHYQMRPAAQPAIVVLIYRFFSLFDINNTTFIAFFLRLISGGLCFLGSWLLYNVFKNEITDDKLKKWYLLLSFSLWFIIFNGVRFSSENWSGVFFVIGFSFYFLLKKRNFVSFLITGAMFGLSFLFRYQAAFLIFGFTLWLMLITKERFINLVYIAAGFTGILLAGVCIDRWFYGEWTLTAWNYFEQNILEDKVSGYGVKPFWWYITGSIKNGIPPFSLLYVITIFATVLFKRKSAVVWSLVPFIIIHSFIGHKEMRFMYPIIGFLPITIIQGIEVIQNRFIKNFSSGRFMKVFMRLFFIVNFAFLLLVMFLPADTNISLLQKIYNKHNKPATLYFIGNDPYRRAGRYIHFYKQKELPVVPIVSLDDIPEGKNNLVVLNKPDTTSHPKLGNLVFSSIPMWMLKFNFNNWLDRTETWYVYEIK